MPDKKISVILRSYNDAQLLPRTLAALRSQRNVSYELIVMESNSTDDSPRILQQEQPDVYVSLPAGGYWSASVLNQGVRLAQHEYIIFLNSDAILEDEWVLSRLVDALAVDDCCVGAFARQTVRSGASIMTRLDYRIAFDKRQHMGEEGAWLSLVCSAIKRSAWQTCAFDERFTYAEDAIWSQEQIERGHYIAYVAEAAAEHSHDYTFKERFKRSYGDRAALSLFSPQPVARTFIGGVVKPLMRRCLKDMLQLCSMGKPLHVVLSPWYRFPQMLGAWRGSQSSSRTQGRQATWRGSILHMFIGESA